MDVTINNEQRLFAIHHGDYVSCLGFDNLFEKLGQLLKRLGRDDERAGPKWLGTLDQYRAYQEAITEAAKRGGFKETWFRASTPAKVRRVLEAARKSGERIRVFTGDVETGRDWGEENDVIGRVSRSTGLMKIPLLVADGELGGFPLLDDCILKVQRVSDGKVLYQHERYQVPQLEIRQKRTRANGRTYTHEVLRDGELHARFTSMGKAANYVAFMHGESFRQPD